MIGRRTVLALAGLGAVVAGIVVATRWQSGGEPGAVVWLVAIGGLLAAAWLRFRRARSTDADAVAPWSGSEPIVEETPEASPRTHPLSGRDLAETLAEATDVARSDRDVEAGLAVVRPPLRAAYVEVAGHAGVDEAAARAALDAGEWTDDRAGAAALSASVAPPPRPPLGRLRDWLYPGRAVRRRTRAAVDALADAADEAVPAVVGANAPRQVPVHRPSLATRTRLADGRLHPGDGEAEPAGGDAR